MMHDQNERPKKILFVRFGPNNLTRTQKTIGCLGLLFGLFDLVITGVFIIFPSVFTQTYPTLFIIWLICIPPFVWTACYLAVVSSIQEMRRGNRVDE